MLHHVGSNEPEILQNVPNIVNYARRRLLDQSSNLAAAPYNGPTIQFSTVPISMSSGSVPAVPDANKKQNQPPPPMHSPPDSPHHDANQNSTNGASGNLWKFIILIIIVVVLVIIIIVLLSIWRKPAAKIITPWKTGISGQLQKAFITGNTSI